MIDGTFMLDASATPAANRRWPRRARRNGFTLIELLTVIAIPSFKDMIQRNRVSGEVNSFVADLMYARAEAIKSGKSVTLCPWTSGTACVNSSTWQSGWMVYYTAEDGSTVVPMRTRPAWSGSDSFTTPTATPLVYTRTGLVSGLAGSGGLLFTLVTNPANTNAQRCLFVNLAGHQTVLTKGQTTGGVTC